MSMNSLCLCGVLISLIQYVAASSCLDGADRAFVSTTRFFVSQQVNLRGPSRLLASAQIKSGDEGSGVHVGARAQHTQTEKHTRKNVSSE